MLLFFFTIFLQLLSVHGLKLFEIPASANHNGTERNTSADQNEDLWDDVTTAVDAVIPVRRPPGRFSTGPPHRLKRVDNISSARWLFGAHHKSGSKLIIDLMRSQINSLKLSQQRSLCTSDAEEMKHVQVHFRCQLSPDQVDTFRNITGTRARIVHIIRDPLRLVVSAYVYHTYKEDGGFSREVNIKDFQKMPIEEGMELITNYAIKNWLRPMTDVYKHNRARGDMYTITMEEMMESSKSFDATVVNVYNFTVGDITNQSTRLDLQEAAKKFDLNRKGHDSHASSIAYPDLTKLAESAVKTLSNETLKQLYEMRDALGYN